MSNIVTYSLSDFPLNKIYNDRLVNEVYGSDISVILNDILIVESVVTLTFSSELTEGDITTLNAIVAAHPNSTIKESNTNSVDPGVSNDIDNGFQPGNIYVNSASGTVFVCIASDPGVAKWGQIYP